MHDVEQLARDLADGNVSVMGEHLVLYVGRCTCSPHMGAHEQHCGIEPIGKIVDLMDSRPPVSEADVEALAKAYDPLAFEFHPIAHRSHAAAVQWAARRHVATEAALRLSAVYYVPAVAGVASGQFPTVTGDEGYRIDVAMGFALRELSEDDGVRFLAAWNEHYRPAALISPVTPVAIRKGDSCAKCRHAEHDGYKCYNMASDSECRCDLRPVDDYSDRGRGGEQS